ncbi:MAG: cation:proton antiporter regulatory subunit [Acidimicrobiales bacterium]|nr:cation:proton antiporter regulatory subunit [Acidimicrobiales bacterium]
MRLVRETILPGVGVRHEFTTDAGEIIGVLVHHDGRRDLLMYDRDDPDTCASTTDLSAADSRVLAEMLGASQVTESLGAVQQEVAGLTLEWIQVPADSEIGSTTIAEGQYRQRTGASIVAVLREGESIPAPGPDFVLLNGDTIVAVATQDGAAALRELILSGP